MLSSIRRKIWKRISPVVTELPYRLALASHENRLPALNPLEQTIVDTCKREGVYVTSLQDLKIGSTSQLLAAAKSQLTIMESIRPTETSSHQISGRSASSYPQIFTVTDLFDFSNWGNESSLLNIAENYVGLPVHFQGVHLRRDFSNDKPVTTELWHQDLEDRRMLKIIIYLTDVSEEHGPFEYIPRSQVSMLLALIIHLRILVRSIRLRFSGINNIGISDQQIERFIPRSKWKTCPGSAGTVIFVDPTAIFHHGKSRKTGRSTLFFVYTSKRPLRPECCTQYSDATFARPELQTLPNTN